MDKKNDIFGKRLKILRNKKGMNQEDAANEIGISRASYSHYETNRVEPDLDIIRKLSEFHNVTTDYLLGRSDDPRLSEQEDKEVDEEVQELLSLLEEMPEKEREEMKKRILAYAKGLSDASKKD